MSMKYRRAPYRIMEIFSLLTLCGFTGQKTHWGGLGFGGSVHEGAHPCFPHFTQPYPLKALMLEAPTAR